MKRLSVTQFGDPILRMPARQLTKKELGSRKIQATIADMRYTLTSVRLGVGLAAPQVGIGIAVAVIVIQPTAHRPDVEPCEIVLVNPVIIQTNNRKKQLWEGCISSGKSRTGLFAKVPRYSRVKLKYMDEHGQLHNKTYEGLVAHVIQHEIDHLDGVLFVDKVKDTRSYMTYTEYMKYVKKAKQ